MPIARALGKAISKSLKKSADDSLKPALSESSDLLPPVSKGVEDDVKTFSNVNDFGIEPELVSSLDEDAFSGLKINKENKENWREINKTSQRSGLLPEIETAAEKLYNREISSEDFRNISKELQPITPLKEVPESPSFEDIAFALTDAQVEKGIVGVNLKIKPRERVASRLDIPAYNDYDTWIVSLHDGTKKSGAAIGYAKTAVLDNVDFVSDSNVALDIARKKQLGSGKKMGKATIARIYGDWIPHDSNKAREIASAVFNDPEWIQVGMNPYRASYFYDKADGMPVLKAEQVIQIGPLVLAKKAIKTTPEDLIFKLKSIEGKSDITFAEGGLVPVTSNEGLAPFGVRHSGDSVKGKGWLGAIPNKQGDISTELSAEMQINGKTIEYPLLVPTLTKEEVDYLVSGEPPTQELYDKAESWALSRIKKGKSPFIEQEEIRFPMPSESAKYAKGGDAMYQMKKLFAEGGMMDDSGEVVNGVEVPTGSLRNEVADDIPARLSEGEFVFPADVVRYLGLETLMKLRDKAKQGLSRMEEIGQVGNAEEVSNPDQTFNGEEDTTQFESDIDSIISEVDQTPQFASGGYMSGTDISKAPKNPVVDVHYFKHADGRLMFITYINGKPMSAVPDGFEEVSLEEARNIGQKAENKEEAAKAALQASTVGIGGDGGGGLDPTGSPSSSGSKDPSNSNAMITVDPATGKATANTIGKVLGVAAGLVFGPIGTIAAKGWNVLSEKQAADWNDALSKGNVLVGETVQGGQYALNISDVSNTGYGNTVNGVAVSTTNTIQQQNDRVFGKDDPSYNASGIYDVPVPGLTPSDAMNMYTDYGTTPVFDAPSSATSDINMATAVFDAPSSAPDSGPSSVDGGGGSYDSGWGGSESTGSSNNDTADSSGGFGGGYDGGGGYWAKGGLVKKRKKSEPAVKKPSKKGLAAKK